MHLENFYKILKILTFLTTPPLRPDKYHVEGDQYYFYQNCHMLSYFVNQQNMFAGCHLLKLALHTKV